MRTSKKIVSLVLAVLMVATMMSVMAVSASALADGDAITKTAELKTAANQGGSYTLANDVNGVCGTAYGPLVNNDLTIDGQGHTIFLNSQLGYLFNLNNNTVNITLKNLTIDAKGIARGAVAAYSGSGGKNTNLITLENCTFKNSDFSTWEDYGTIHAFGKSSVVMTNCKFENNKNKYMRATDVFFGGGGTLTIQGDETSVNDVLLNGGTATAVVKDNATVGKITTAGKNAEDVLTIEAGSTVEAVVDKNGVNTEMSSNAITNEAELTAALAAGGHYILANNLEVTAQMVAGKDFSLDLNGYTLTSPASVDVGLQVVDGANVTFDKGTLQLNNNYYGFRVAGATFNVPDNLVINTPEGSMIATNGVINVSGKITATKWFAIGVNGSTSHNYVINILTANAYVKSTAADAAGIYHCNDGTLNIKNGTVEGASAVIIKSGTTKITGGTLIGTIDAVPFAHNGNGAEPTGDALLVESCNYPGGTPDITVTGGTFKTTGEGTKDVGVYSQNSAAYPEASQFITGGTYDDDSASGYVAEGYFLPKKADGTYKPDKTTSTTSQSLEDGDPLKGVLLRTSYRYASIAGAQEKVAITGVSTGTEGNDINAAGVRFVAVVNEGILKGDNVTEYGFVVAKVSSSVTNPNYNNLTAYGGNGQKTIPCTGSSNTFTGEYGKYNTSTTYKYVTLAVNGTSATGEQAVARFYYKTADGNTYYGVAQTTTSSTPKNGAIAPMPAVN